jgi:hypothetical protein
MNFSYQYPYSKIRMALALRTVDKLCAMTNTVRPCINISMPFPTKRSGRALFNLNRISVTSHLLVRKSSVIYRVLRSGMQQAGD